MGNLYYGRSLDQLLALCTAEYRFYRNSLRNFRPGNIGSGTGVSDMGEYLNDGDTSPKQSMALGIPAMCIDYATGSFGFPTNFDDVLGEEAAFSVEYFGVVQDRLIPDNYMALLGENAATDPYVGLRDDGRIEMNFGTQQISAQIDWWWKDSLIHFVVSRESGEDPDTNVYINGSQVNFASNAAGAGGFTDAAGHIFNHTDDQGANHPWWGHHFMLRQYSVELTKPEVLELYQDVQRLIPHHLLHIPIYQSA